MSQPQRQEDFFRDYQALDRRVEQLERAYGQIRPPYVTSLQPGLGQVPVQVPDGFEVYFVASATNGVVWRLRYNSGSASSYKWEVVGGAPLHLRIDTDETFSGATAWVDATTAGPTITVPLAGDYEYDASANLYSSGQTAAATFHIGLKLGAAAMGNEIGQSAPTILGNGCTVGRSGKLTALAVSTAVKMQYTLQGSGGTPHCRFRDLRLMPVRVG